METTETQAAKTVVIDGVEYVPKTTFISEETQRALAKAYGVAWGEGYYDPYHNGPCVQRFRDLADALSDANKELKFKR